MAAHHGLEELTEQLLENGANANALDDVRSFSLIKCLFYQLDCTPAHYALVQGK